MAHRLPRAFDSGSADSQPVSGTPLAVEGQRQIVGSAGQFASALHGERFLRMRDVCAKVGLSMSSRQQQINDTADALWDRLVECFRKGTE